MKVLANSTSNLVLGIAMLVASPIATCAQEATASLDAATAIAAVDKQVANDLSAELRAARAVPHPVRIRRPPSVEVSDMNAEAATEMYVVIVEASRLPPLDVVTARVGHYASSRF